MDSLFFIASKVLWYLLQPVNVLLWLFVVGLALLYTRFAKAGRRVLVGVLLTVLLLGVLPADVWLRVPLEERFPIFVDPPGNVAGIVVLSGGMNARVSAARGQAALGGDAERMTETLVLMRRFPQAQVVFSGFSGRLFPVSDDGAHKVARMFFESQGVAVGRVRYETRSRNTYENGLYTRRLVKPKPGEVWLLVTSAAHMPRSIGVFRGLGWDLVAVPVDFGTTGDLSLVPQWFCLHCVFSFNAAVREWLGLLAYYLSDRTDAFFPAPAAAPRDAAETFSD